MGRPPRNSHGGYVYHVVGRGLKSKPMFRCEEDYLDFDLALAQAIERFEPRLLAYCVLPKHWHLVLTPRRDGDLSKFMAWLTTTHSARWHTKPRRSGTGGLYERRFRSFPVQDDAPLMDILHFVESHPLRAGLASSIQDWQWSSAARRNQPPTESVPQLSLPPLPFPADWKERLSLAVPSAMLDKIELCIQRGRPYGEPFWVEKTAIRMSLESTLRPRGRPARVIPN